MNKHMRKNGITAHKFMIEIHMTKVELKLAHQCRISVIFKRGEHKKETVNAPVLDKGIAYFDEKLAVPSIFYFDEAKNAFVSKEATLALNMISSKAQRLMGVTKFDLSVYLNNGMKDSNVELKMEKCFDKAAKFHFRLKMTQLSELDPCTSFREDGEATSQILDENNRQSPSRTYFIEKNQDISNIMHADNSDIGEARSISPRPESLDSLHEKQDQGILSHREKSSKLDKDRSIDEKMSKKKETTKTAPNSHREKASPRQVRNETVQKSKTMQQKGKQVQTQKPNQIIDETPRFQNDQRRPASPFDQSKDSIKALSSRSGHSEEVEKLRRTPTPPPEDLNEIKQGRDNNFKTEKRTPNKTKNTQNLEEAPLIDLNSSPTELATFQKNEELARETEKRSPNKMNNSYNNETQQRSPIRNEPVVSKKKEEAPQRDRKEFNNASETQYSDETPLISVNSREVTISKKEERVQEQPKRGANKSSNRQDMELIRKNSSSYSSDEEVPRRIEQENQEKATRNINRIDENQQKKEAPLIDLNSPITTGFLMAKQKEEANRDVSRDSDSGSEEERPYAALKKSPVKADTIKSQKDEEKSPGKSLVKTDTIKSQKDEEKSAVKKVEQTVNNEEYERIVRDLKSQLDHSHEEYLALNRSYEELKQKYQMLLIDHQTLQKDNVNGRKSEKRADFELNIYKEKVVNLQRELLELKVQNDNMLKKQATLDSSYTQGPKEIHDSVDSEDSEAHHYQPSSNAQGLGYAQVKQYEDIISSLRNEVSELTTKLSESKMQSYNQDHNQHEKHNATQSKNQYAHQQQMHQQQVANNKELEKNQITIAELTSGITKLRKEVEQKNCKIGLLEIQIRDLEDEVQVLKLQEERSKIQSLDLSNHSLEKIDFDPKGSNETPEALQKNIQELTVQNINLKRELDQLRRILSLNQLDRERHKDEAQNQVVNQRNEADDSEIRITKLETENARLASELKKAKMGWAAADIEKYNSMSAAKENQDKLKVKEERIDFLEVEVFNLKSRLAELVNNVMEFGGVELLDKIEEIVTLDKSSPKKFSIREIRKSSVLS